MFKAYKRYFDFQGRSSRSEYWLFVLFYAIVIAAYVMAAIVLNDPYGVSPAGRVLNILYWAFVAASLIPHIAVGVRRLHDTDRSGWLLLLGLIPLVGLILLYFFVQKGTAGPNKYGPDPLGKTDAEVFA